jgi:2-succinyl-6-hydroxy-2,4-cyclohexadiene-1-carboxylate synthase
MKSYYHSSHLGKLHYLDNLPSQLKETIVFLHGFTGSSRDFLNIPDDIANQYRCLIPDLPGHGKTRVLETETVFSTAGQVALLASWLNSLKIPKIHLFGYSMGGRLAIQFATKNPHHLKSLMLVSTTAGIEIDADRLARTQSDLQIAKTILGSTSIDFLKAWLLQPLFRNIAARGDKFLQQEVLRRMPIQPLGLVSSLKYFSTGVMPPVWTQLNDIQIPTLVIAGSQDPKYLDIAFQLANLVPHSTLKILETGHAPLIESPDLLWKQVSYFLKHLQIPKGGKI